jgi:hypothetical protein
MKAFLLKAENRPLGIVVGDEDEVNSRLQDLNESGKKVYSLEEYPLLNEETYETFQRVRNLIDTAYFEYYCPDCNQLRLNARSEGDVFCGNCGKPNIIKGVPGSLNKEALSKKFGWV